jgi:hypothetical protein
MCKPEGKKNDKPVVPVIGRLGGMGDGARPQIPRNPTAHVGPAPLGTGPCSWESYTFDREGAPPLGEHRAGRWLHRRVRRQPNHPHVEGRAGGRSGGGVGGLHASSWDS